MSNQSAGNSTPHDGANGNGPAASATTRFIAPARWENDPWRRTSEYRNLVLYLAMHYGRPVDAENETGFPSIATMALKNIDHLDEFDRIVGDAQDVGLRLTNSRDLEINMYNDPEFRAVGFLVDGIWRAFMHKTPEGRSILVRQGALAREEAALREEMNRNGTHEDQGGDEE